MSDIATERIAGVDQKLPRHLQDNKRPATNHIIDHLECAGILARQNKLDTVFYLVKVAIAAARENITAPRKRRT